MLTHLKTLITRWQNTREVDNLSREELADMGMTRDQVRTFTRMSPRVAQRVTAMGQVFGAPQAALTRDPAEWADLLSGCDRCADKGACGVALSRGDITQPSDAGFCPNRGTFTRLALPTS